MDFTDLQKQYDNYWSSHNLSAVIQNLAELDNYISAGNYDTWLIPYDKLLTPEYLLSNYAVSVNQNIGAVKISYSDLIKWFSNYINSLIKEITDNKKELEALKTKSLLDELFDSPIGQAVLGVGNIFEGVGNLFKNFYWIIIPIAGFIVYTKFIKKG